MSHSPDIELDARRDPYLSPAGSIHKTMRRSASASREIGQQDRQLEAATELEVGAAEETSSLNVSELAPVDRGFRAWLFCICSFSVEFLLFAWNNSFGVFQDYYSSHPPFENDSPAVISIVGTVSLAIQYGLIIFFLAACQRYPEHAKLAMWVSLAVSVVSLAISSFATQIWHLIILQGVTFGFGAGVAYAPILLWLSQWFMKRRGLASGLIFAGSGTGGFVGPLIIGAMLEKVGFRWTLRIYALIMGVGSTIALLGLNPRLPARKPTTDRPRPAWVPSDLTFLKNPRIILTLLAVLFQALAYSPVSIFISTYTSSLSSSSLSSTISLALFNVMATFGYLSFGRLCDLYPYPFIIFVVGVGSALSALLLWGFATSLALVFVFAAIFGALNGGFTALYPTAAANIVGEHPEHISVTIGIFSAGKGLGALVGPVIAASLRKSTSSPSHYGAFGFRNVQIFVGAMAVGTSLGALALLVLPSKRFAIHSHR